MDASLMLVNVTDDAMAKTLELVAGAGEALERKDVRDQAQKALDANDKKAVAELDDDQKIARRKQQRRFKARRILREAIRLSTEEASVAGIDLQGGDFQRLVKIAVEIKKAAAALATSDLLCELGDIQLAMMAAAGKPPQHQA